MAADWKPTFIDIEPAFDRLVASVRGGRLVRELMPAAPNLPLNADYIFPEDDVIAELKCLEKKPC
jgi:hypothetical protein